MGLFRTTRIACPRGVWTVLMSHAFVQMPKSWHIRFHSEAGEPVEGHYSEKRHLWIFPQAPLQGALLPDMDFERRWINTFYSLQVCPTVDLIAEID